MRIQTNQQNFQGINIATAQVKMHGYTKNYGLYKITPRDTNYLKKLAESIDLPKLWTGLKPSDYIYWSRMIHQTVVPSIWDNDSEIVLITDDKKPCGAIKYKLQKGLVEVKGRVTWPLEPNEKVQFAGTVLYLDLFKNCIDSGINLIKTVVVRNAPFDTLSKCLALGFRSNGGDDCNELMSINSSRMSKTLDKFKYQITMTSNHDDMDVDLFEGLSL